MVPNQLMRFSSCSAGKGGAHCPSMPHASSSFHSATEDAGCQGDARIPSRDRTSSSHHSVCQPACSIRRIIRHTRDFLELQIFAVLTCFRVCAGREQVIYQMITGFRSRTTNTTVAVNYPQDTRIWRSMGVVRIHGSEFTSGTFFKKIAF